MASDQEKFEKQERAKRLKAARETAGISGPKGVVSASDGQINENVYKGHESGRNGFSVSDGRVYADLFDVSLEWLYLGEGSPTKSKPIARKAKGETEVKELLRQIEGLPEAAIEPLWGLVTFYLPKGDDQSEDSPSRDQSEPASLHRV
ncbi:helix-turn-helix transcriptional regulator [Neorhizobium sp. SOG26]|uniref:helix-turn-helix transcriptional regulator n=1 Tax=Neorhizobium sp. SOG26 TaxID=2060726 RepID=UPI0012376AA5|nr:helix-turn-helix transcriptional regulator [Neorhizobium sp. SOG26]